MKVILAQPRSFCAGVVRAIDIVGRVLEKYGAPVYARQVSGADRACRHPEVEGTMGRIPGPVYLVQSEEDVAALELAPGTPLAYVTQTTLNVDDTRSIIMALKRRFTDIVGPETKDICYATPRPSVLRPAPLRKFWLKRLSRRSAALAPSS
jgi:4-hydroxy-3-methylbut-2-enyl diphosphate reductase IspH